MTPEREAKFKEVISNRWADLTVILENVQDPHNIFAIMRTCDAVGVREIYVLNTRKLWDDNIGKRSSAGVKKWVDVRHFNDRDECLKVIKNRYKRVLATKLKDDATPLYEVDFNQPTALAFGNERYGISDELAALCDGNFLVPQIGMAGSLNISVACAVSMYEAFRQRHSSNEKNRHLLPPEEAQNIFERWQENQRSKRRLKT